MKGNESIGVVILSKPVAYYKKEDRTGKMVTHPIFKPKRRKYRQPSMQVVRVEAPPNTAVIITEKQHNPTTVRMEEIRSPVSGAPLEPPKEYGATITRDPYTGAYVYVTPPEHGQRVKPTYTEFTEKAEAILKQEILQAEEEVKKGNLEQAYHRLAYARDTVQLGAPKEFRWKEPLFRKFHISLGVVKRSYEMYEKTTDPANQSHHAKRIKKEVSNLAEIARNV